MPPVRTIPAAKPLKTERTHEENQERAYIAASRRSDRSLEARVESARRASEIHKRRTGRSLRVTEQDVINEEMYEEEDDDLPMQYRRLTAHLQTTNADFDRRLAAYLTNHVAMRTALGQAVSDQYIPQQYPNAPQFANQMAQFAQDPYNPMLPPQMVTNRSPSNYRQSPYTTTNQHQRSASIAASKELQSFQNAVTQNTNNTFDHRRMSLPVQAMVSPSYHGAQSTSPKRQTPPTVSRTSSSSSLTNLKHEASQQGRGTAQPSTFPKPFTMAGSDSTSMGMNGFPFSMSLPTETQQLLGPAFDPMDPLTGMLMSNQSSRFQQPFYSYNPNGASKTKGMGGQSSYEGMNQTLAPSVLDMSSSDQRDYGTPSSTADSMTPHGSYGASMFGYESNFADAFKPVTGSGLTTPGEHDWANLIDSNAWDEPSSQSAVA